MSLTPGYGETPLDYEELTALLPAVREAFGETLTKAAIYDLEQAVQDEVAENLLTAVIEGELALDELLVDHFVRDLHRHLYSDIWRWAGIFRTHELNIGIAPEQIAVELRKSIGSIRHRWKHTADWTARELGIAVHAETVRIHPFTDGNGRTTRLWADLVFVAAQDTEEVQLYDWQLNKRRYIDLLRQYDAHRDVRNLAAFVGVKPLGE
jgi:fido (protein-threonine AMPylation protein)